LKIKYLIAIASTLILLLSIFDNRQVLREGPECIEVLVSGDDIPNAFWLGREVVIGYRICAIGFVFKWIGFILSAIGFLSILIPSMNKKGIRIIVISFAIISLILSLPFYHVHSGWVNSHGHSFWDGGWHLH